MNIYEKNSVVINKVSNGFKVAVKGSFESQEDKQDGEYVFTDIKSLNQWLVKYYS